MYIHVLYNVSVSGYVVMGYDIECMTSLLITLMTTAIVDVQPPVILAVLPSEFARLISIYGVLSTTVLV